jgi:hypothetical protein
MTHPHYINIIAKWMEWMMVFSKILLTFALD